MLGGSSTRALGESRMNVTAGSLASFFLLSWLVAVGTARADPLEADSPKVQADQRAESPSDRAEVIPPVPEDAARNPVLPQSLCATIVTAATENGLPVHYFARVIWQESRLRPDAVGPLTRSGERAQGIAQFMPATGAERVVLNPFDPVEALPKSAAFLRQLRAEFGNLGLAAAAYNAGPQRVRSWLAGRRALPAETLAYVRSVTGRSAEEWKRPGANDSNLTVAADTPCAEGANLTTGSAHPGQTEKSEPISAWVVQLVGDRSESGALASYDHQPVIARTTTGASAAAIWHRVRVAAGSRVAAETLCSRLRAAGGSCLVQHD